MLLRVDKLLNKYHVTQTCSTYCLSKCYNHTLKLYQPVLQRQCFLRGQSAGVTAGRVCSGQHYGKNCASKIFYWNCEFWHRSESEFCISQMDSLSNTRYFADCLSYVPMYRCESNTIKTDLFHEKVKQSCVGVVLFQFDQKLTEICFPGKAPANSSRWLRWPAHR